jgi:signal transduction histidine kinase
MKQNLSSKISLILSGIIFTIVFSIITVVYMLSKDFYKQHLVKMVDHEIKTISQMLEVNFDVQMLSSLINKDEVISVVMYNVNYQPVFISNSTANELVDDYQNWIKTLIQNGGIPEDGLITDDINTIEYHLPHIWSVKPVRVKGELHGYLFMDHNTVGFQKTKEELLYLLLTMGTITFFIGLLMTIYLFNKITKPLNAMGKATNQIANGQLDVDLSINSNDEIGHLARDIISMANQLRHYRDTRQQFLSHISHDLRTPLTYIKGYSSIIKDAENINQIEWHKYIGIIYKEATYMEQLVKDLFELTKLEEGKMSLYFEEVNLVSWINEILDSRQISFEKSFIKSMFVYDNENVRVLMDRERMGQVFNNLLENSIRHSHGGEISIRLKPLDQNYICIELSDTGSGIPEQDLPFIWERFYRVDKSRSSQNGGSGLGLAIVKQLVTLHNGTISVKSILGKGTTFSIKLKVL